MDRRNIQRSAAMAALSRATSTWAGTLVHPEYSYTARGPLKRRLRWEAMAGASSASST
jgi:hypothetical protein